MFAIGESVCRRPLFPFPLSFPFPPHIPIPASFSHSRESGNLPTPGAGIARTELGAGRA